MVYHTTYLMRAPAFEVLSSRPQEKCGRAGRHASSPAGMPRYDTIVRPFLPRSGLTSTGNTSTSGGNSDTKNQLSNEPEFPHHSAGRPRQHQSQPSLRQHRYTGGGSGG